MKKEFKLAECCDIDALRCDTGSGSGYGNRRGDGYNDCDDDGVLDNHGEIDVNGDGDVKLHSLEMCAHILWKMLR